VGWPKALNSHWISVLWMVLWARAMGVGTPAVLALLQLPQRLEQTGGQQEVCSSARSKRQQLQNRRLAYG
jgi:hypothetical protein